MPDILNQIDDVLADLSCCAFCKTTLVDRGPSGDFCGEICQWEWSARRLGVQSCIEMVPAFPGAAPTEPPSVLPRPPSRPTRLGPINPQVHEAYRQEVRRQGFTAYSIDGVDHDVDQPVTYGIDPARDGSACIVIARVDADGQVHVAPLALPVDAALEPAPTGDEVADFAEEVLGVEVDPWQRQMLNRLYADPPRDRSWWRRKPWRRSR